MSNAQRLRFESQKIIPLGNSRIDRDNKIIRDVVAMQVGEGKDSRDLGVDYRTLEMMATLGNAKQTLGILQRFGHPGASENAMGYQVARAKNFRVVGNHLIHDSHLILSASKSPRFEGDVLDYLMSMADESPDDFGESVVIYTDLAWVLEDGTEQPYWIEDEDGYYKRTKKPDNLKYDYPVMRPEKFHNVDYVMEGNLTDGLFATAMFDNSSHGDLFELFTIADAAIERYNIPIEDIPSKIAQIGNAFIAKQGLDRRLTMSQEDATKGVVPPVEENTEDSAPEPTTDALATLQQQVDAMSTRLNEREEEETITISRAEFDQLNTRVSTLSSQVEQFTGLVAGLLSNMTVLETNQGDLDSKLRALNNEQVMTTSVPNNHQPTNPMDWFNNQQPVHFLNRQMQDYAKEGQLQQQPSSPSVNAATESLASSLNRQSVPND